MNARGLSLALAGLLLAGCAGNGVQPAGSGTRTLSPVEAQSLREGRGMGMAAVAEINGYPGPMHVLELKDELKLTPDQRFATSRLLGLIQGQVRALGERIIAAEEQLDADMANGKLSREQVRGRIQAIAALRGQLRYVHVDAHLQQQKILTPEQIGRYYDLRGRKVVVPAPQAPPPVTEPLELQPAETAHPAVEMPPDVVTPVSPASPAPQLPADTAPAEIRAPADTSTPVMPAETAPALPLEDKAPETGAAPPALTPGMRDAMDDAEPASAAPVENPRVEDSAPDMEEATPDATLDPGAQDALEDAQPARAPAPVRQEPAMPEPDPVALTPGMRDAMEFAEPDKVYIAPLEEEEIETPMEEDKPSEIVLDN